MKKYLIITTLATMCLSFSCTSMEEPEKLSHQDPAEQLGTKAYGDKSPKIIAYVETNDTNPLNAGDYFTEDGEPFVDIVELFAANLWRETVGGAVRPVLHLNDKLTNILENSGVDMYVKPLQEMGIKVLLTVICDWTGLGFANMNDTQAQQFAEIMAFAVEKYGLDGVGLNDEYANYQDSLVDGSFGNIIKKLHALLPPDKLITTFEWGYIDSSQINSEAGALLDYAYTGYTYWNKTSSIAGMTNDRWAPSSYLLGNTYSNSTLNLINYVSQRASDEGYGAIMTFNIRQSSDVDPMPVFQAMSDGIGCGTLYCDDGDRARDVVIVPYGYNITYSDIQ